MNHDLLKKHIAHYLKEGETDPEKRREDQAQRKERIEYYQSWSRERLMQMEADGLYEYMSKLWAMLIWGNKHYVVDKLIKEHGLPTVRRELAELVWGTATIDKRWDHFRKTIKGMGPAMISEILSHAHPEKYMLWSRRVFVGLNYLGVSGLPRYDYQFTGKKYVELIGVTDGIVSALRAAGVKDANHLTADYFIWDELQVEENLSNIFRPSKSTEIPLPKIVEKQESSFIHDEIRDKLADIGQWLGFKSNVEIKVADGSKVDTVWEATIGNMGRVIYIFEVQTKGSIDSLILNLLKSLNNPAVQGVVAVSDHAQLEKIKRHAASVPNLKEKLKYWDYQNVLQVHEALAGVYESINGLGLVPAGF